MGVRLDAMKKAATKIAATQKRIAALPITKPTATPAEPKKEKPPKAEALRKCCATGKGQIVPHADDCVSKTAKRGMKAIRRQPVYKRPRLPDKSRYECRYTSEGEGGYWDGTLYIGGDDPCVFTSRAWAVMILLQKLDMDYRKYLSQKGSA